MKLVSICSLVILTGLTTSCGNKNSSLETANSVAFDLVEVTKVIKEKTDMFTQAHITRDTSFLNNIFTKDANAYPPDSDVVSGRAAIAAVNFEWVNYGIKEFTEETTSFYGNEEYLIDEGKYYLRYGEDDVIDKGNYINIWKKENGEWKICGNIWNSNMPAVKDE